MEVKKKMAKKTKKLLFITVILSLLLIFSTYKALVPNVHATETILEEKGLSILRNVVGLDLTKYTVVTKEYPQDPQPSYLNVIPQETLAYDLTSDNSKLKALYTFANGNLRMIHVLENEGQPSVTKTISANSIEMAKNFLDNYQAYTANSLFGELESTLNNLDVGKNYTIASQNIVLEASVINGDTAFKWYYAANGAIAPYSKSIALGFKDGFLTAFVDDWQFYNVGSVTINLSKEEASSIALNTAKTFAYNKNLTSYGFEAKNINESNVRWTSLIFDGSLDANKARSEDPLELYPVWRVGIAYDKWYGQIYGIQVDIWADTREVRAVHEAWSTLPPPEEVPTANMTTGVQTSQTFNVDSSNPLTNQGPLATPETAPDFITWPAFSLIAIVFTGIALISVVKKKSRLNMLKPRFSKTCGILLCFLLMAMILLASFATVGAEIQQGVAVSFASRSTGAYDPNFHPNDYNWRKSLVERGLQGTVCYNITHNDFPYAGYYSFNSASDKAQILYTLSDLHNTYNPIAVVDFDHGLGRDDYSLAPGEFHYMFEDDVGTGLGPIDHKTWEPDNGVFDMDIYPRVNGGQVIFAFINTCYSANLTLITDKTIPWQGNGTYGALGLPYALTHRIVKYLYSPGFNTKDDISENGFLLPDGGHQVYIGFADGSASLEQPIPYPNGTKQYYQWVNDFFYFATHYDISVNDALDHASWSMWQCPFGQSPLWTGFTPYWWNFEGNWPIGTMAVYGNGNVHLKLYSLTVNSPVTTADVYIDDYYRGTTGNSFAVDSGSHVVRVDSSTHVFHNFNGYAEFENPIAVSVTQDTTVTANYYTNPPPQYTLSISAGEGGTTQAPYTPGNYQCTPGLVTLTAEPYNDYLFDHWLLDDNEHTENPITVPMSTNHDLQALFVPNPPYSYISSIASYDGPVYGPENLAGWQNDGQFATLEGYGPYQYYGWISGAMNAPASGHIYVYGYGNGGPLYVYTSYDGYYYDLVSVPYVSSGSPYWIDCGTCASTFNYILLTAEDWNYVYGIALDSVRVEP